ncbi:MAG: cyclopropane fatty acyl phospholipid synthase [Candidatus Pacebacteria bacterium]|nr:cyclopropane fatty acyl phospholipid synthase [Candidatus Paceibacterota bacterium]
MSFFKEKIQNALLELDIKINGMRPWDVQVHDERLYREVALRGSLGLGEAYMNGWWTCKKLDEFFHRVLQARLQDKYKGFGQDLFHWFANLLNKQTITRSRKVVEKHYDLGNDLYTSFLDPYNQYTCGYFKNTDDLNKAQEQKLDLICRKLDIKSTDKVLDIGCGWGGFAKWASEHYGCHVTGVSISDEQIAYAKKFTAGLPVDIIKADYREIKGEYDKILICGMIEHVGSKNYRTIMKVVNSHLKDGGRFLLHTIGDDSTGDYEDPWIGKYIFPNSVLPKIKQLGQSIEGLFVMEDWHNFGAYYDKTLLAWQKNFEQNWKKLKHTYDERFHLMWNYYFLSCAGAFRARYIQLWQIVLTKEGLPKVYESVR